MIGSLLAQMYGDPEADIPRLVLVTALPAEAELTVLAEWLAQRRGAAVRVAIPRRGDKRTLLETVERNAAQSLATHKLRRSGDLTARSQALNEISEALDLATPRCGSSASTCPTSGADDVVASMVVFEDGLPRPSEYRRFAIKGFEGQNDVAAIAEVIRRRFRRLAQSNGGVASGVQVTGLADDQAARPPESGPISDSESIEPGPDRGSC